MFDCVFERNDGTSFLFGKSNNIVYDIDVGNGIPVNISTAQGFSQIGETVESIGVSGRSISISGCIFGKNITEVKRSMRKALAPLTSGKLTIGNKFYCTAYVQNAPSFSTMRENGQFSLQLFSPTPYFFKVGGFSETLGAVTKLFTFPVNYSTPHKFGETEIEKYKNFYNDGDVPVPFSLTATAFGSVGSIIIKNILNGNFLEIQNPDGDVLSADEQLRLYRDDGGILRVEKIVDNEATSVISWLNTGSNLFELSVGDNQILVEDGNSVLAPNFYSIITFNPAVWSVFE